jgi:predicted negative regulator of RcsB-dependent stress response
MSEDIEIINQNTRIEKIKNFFSNNYKKLIGSLLLILLVLFSYFGFQEYKKKLKLEIADIYNQITLKEITIENTNDIEQLIKIIKEKDPIYSVLSLYFIIENDLVNDQKEINNFFDLVINSQKEKEIKNLIIYKKAMYNADIISENELLDILNPILKSESAWKSHALLLMADYFEHNNDLIKSKDFLEEIVNSELVNNEIRIEAERRLKRKSSD